MTACVEAEVHAWSRWSSNTAEAHKKWHTQEKCNKELTVEEVVELFGMKNPENMMSVAPVLPNAGNVYLFVNSGTSKLGM